MILLARTTPLEAVRKPSEGLSLFFIPFDQKKAGLDLKRIKKMGIEPAYLYRNALVLTEI
jgi:acyl-CoA dehydrogenase